ncbi:hypothetical protein [Pseudomonas sp. Irchel s3b5]|uniref:hypothetical protein n=1 Tax=Pseudomonas sp. Irchel s3b5 TaxID=2009077 RepID=UPI000BA39046|nr:hypothetical protein [Pseudomonas sp. Irchel s3b5]
MINLHKDRAVWLVPDEQVSKEFRKAVELVRQVYRKEQGASGKSTSGYKVDAAFRHGLDVRAWSVIEIQRVLESTFRNSKLTMGDIDASLRLLPVTYNESLSAFFKMVFVVLWGQRVFLAPLSIQTITHQDQSLDALCEKLGVECLTIIRSVHPGSNLVSIFKRAEFNDGSSRVNFWLRLLLSTTFYNVSDMNHKDCQALFDGANGIGLLPLRRYYVSDFLLTLSSASVEKQKLVEGIIEYYQISKREQIEKNSKERLACAGSLKQSEASILSEAALVAAKDLALGLHEFDFDVVFKTHYVPHRIKSLFGILYDGALSPFYQTLHPKVLRFITMVDKCFKSYVKSKRLQRSGNQTFVCNLLLSYLSSYLPGFFIRRDGTLENYPSTINEFHCTLYFTREAIFVDGVIAYEKNPPKTFLGYLEAFSQVNCWVNETQYSRVLVVDEFCEYLQSNRLVLPNATDFSNTFTSACYPVVQKKSGTVKKPIPRPYFATFLSMLYSLEYIVEHINKMAAGEVCGVLNGELYQPSMVDLLESHTWAGLIAKEVKGIGVVNTDLLNYCPIFYHEGRVQSFDFIPRFYSIIDFEINNELVKRISPNEVRVTQLMCETGLRQHHIIWLDKDRYDCVLDRYSKSQLAPLFVSSDKSHGEWTAIVSRHVIDVMDRQRAWYNSNSSEAYKQDLWYGMKEGSKFGQYKPLFRNSNNTASSWANYRHFPIYLLMLQHFIREVMQDDSGEDLVFLKCPGAADEPIAGYDQVFISRISVNDLTSPHTPHALRAGFVSEAIRFLPPSIIGQYMTGQTEELVWYYTIFDDQNMPDHQKLLADYMLKNMDRFGQGDAPELAEAVLKMNARLMSSIQQDPVKAIEIHGLMSLTGVTEEQSGIEVLRAKRYTKLAYNNCHICPFDNHCPREVVAQIGFGRPCALCPYAIRGVDHLGAVSAEKDKAKEMMAGIMSQLGEYRALKRTARNPQVLESLNEEYDRYAREAYALEAIEQQLYIMAQNGDSKSFFLKEKDGLMAHYAKINLTDSEHVLKRYVDVLNFPNVLSPQLDAKFAYLRNVMLVQQNRISELLKVDDRPACHQLASQISSMMTTGALSVQDIFRINHASGSTHLQGKPTPMISATIGVVLQED